MTDRPLQRWQARPFAAAFVRVVALLVPLSIALLTTWYLVSLAPPPTTVAGAVAVWVLATAFGALLLRVLDRLTRRLLPLARALQLSLAFPASAPSRAALALSKPTDEALDELIEKTRRHGLSRDPTVAVTEILSLTHQLDTHDEITRGHSDRVRTYTLLIAREMGLPDTHIERLQWVGFLHDIGKLGVPCHILNKPGKLDEAEWEIIRLHPAIGAAMVEPLRGWLGDDIDGVGQHHERWDGDGYPAGLSGPDISLAARIIAVADVFDVITARRSYKEASPPEEALQEIARCSGTQFDERVVRALLAIPVRRLRRVIGPFALLGELPLLGSLLTNLGPATGTVATSVAGGTAAVASAIAVAVTPTPPAVFAMVTGAQTGIAATAGQPGGQPLSAGAAPVDTPRRVSDETQPEREPATDEPTVSATSDARSPASPGSTTAERTSEAPSPQSSAAPSASPSASPSPSASSSPQPASRPASPGPVLRDDVLETRVHGHVVVTLNDESVLASTVAIVQAPAHAKDAFFALDDNGHARLHYHAASGYEGPDSMTYRACNADGVCATASISITVIAQGGSGGPPAGGGQPANGNAANGKAP